MADYRLTQTGQQVQTDLNNAEQDNVTLREHVNNSTIHVTEQNKVAWNAKYDKPGSGIPASDLAAAVQTALEKAMSAYQKPGTGIPKSDLTSALQTAIDKALSAYQKPDGGIPKTDLAAAVQSALEAAVTAYQKPNTGIPKEDMTTEVQTILATASSQAEQIIAEAQTRQDADQELQRQITTHVSNSDIHVTTQNKSAWNSKYDKPSGGIPKSDMTSGVQTSLGKADTAYQKPGTGIPKGDLASDVQTSLTKADNSQTQAQVQAIVASALESYSTTNEVATAITNALAAYYTKTAVDTIVEGLQSKLTFDLIPTQNSNNPVTSEGIRVAIANAVNGLVNSEYVQSAISNALQNYSSTTQVGTIISTAITTALANYYTKTQVDNELAKKTDKLTMTGAGAAVEDDIMVIDENGNIKDGGKKISDLQLKVTDCAMLGGGFPTCTTAGGTAAKTVTISNFLLLPNCRISVLFQNAFTASNPTLSINGGTAIAIKHFGRAMEVGKVHANTILTMVYDGTYWQVTGIESMTGSTPSGAVDLALPSGLLWCEHNVGAASPYDDGLYFSWGNVEGHTGTDGYDFGTTNDGPYASTPGAALTGNISVDGTYDAARHNMGAPWRMPTQPEFQELNDNCTSEWADEDGVAGRRFISRINGNSIFFPASGYRDGTSLGRRGSNGCYWSSTLYSSAYGYFLSFNSGGVNPADTSNRFYGLSVRAVQ